MQRYHCTSQSHLVVDSGNHPGETKAKEDVGTIAAHDVADCCILWREKEGSMLSAEWVGEWVSDLSMKALNKHIHRPTNT